MVDEVGDVHCRDANALRLHIGSNVQEILSIRNDGISYMYDCHTQDAQIPDEGTVAGQNV